MSIKLQPLPFDYTALAPHISEDTLRTHHDKHHKRYVDTLNELIKGTEFEEMKLSDIVIKSADKKDENLKIFNNAGQAWNHNFYWGSLSPKPQQPSKAFMALLEKSFGSFDKFQVEFLKKSAQLFGSGWVWLVSENDQLSLFSTQNADNPLTTDKTALFTCDVWEHAYYLDYKNERDNYAKNVWKILNWNFAEANYEARQMSKDMSSERTTDRTSDSKNVSTGGSTAHGLH